MADVDGTDLEVLDALVEAAKVGFGYTGTATGGTRFTIYGGNGDIVHVHFDQAGTYTYAVLVPMQTRRGVEMTREAYDEWIERWVMP